MNDPLSQAVSEDLARIRSKSPIVLNVTNYVAMDITANALLSLGASPIMAHAQEELEDLVSLCDAVVLNMGTLDAEWGESILKAANLAKQAGKPVIFDPVGAGASCFRTHFAKEVMRTEAVGCVRGNGSEILALYDGIGASKGVDSACASVDAAEWVLQQGGKLAEVVAVSGATDYVVWKDTCRKITSGDPLMTRVTAMGCTATALTGAFAAVNPKLADAALHALAVMGTCGEWARAKSQGPGSFRVAFLDALSHVGPDALSKVKATAHVV